MSSLRQGLQFCLGDIALLRSQLIDSGGRLQGEPPWGCEKERPVCWLLSMSLTGLRLAGWSERTSYNLEHRLTNNWKKFIVAFEMLNTSSNDYSNDDIIIAKGSTRYFYVACFESCDTVLFSSLQIPETATVIISNTQGIHCGEIRWYILNEALKWPFEEISMIHELGSSELQVFGVPTKGGSGVGKGSYGKWGSSLQVAG